MSNLEFDGALLSSSEEHAPFQGGAKDVACVRGGRRGVPGGSMITAVVGRSGEKVDLVQVIYTDFEILL